MGHTIERPSLEEPALTNLQAAVGRLRLGVERSPLAGTLAPFVQPFVHEIILADRDVMYDIALSHARQTMHPAFAPQYTQGAAHSAEQYAFVLYHRDSRPARTVVSVDYAAGPEGKQFLWEALAAMFGTTATDSNLMIGMKDLSSEVTGTLQITEHVDLLRAMPGLSTAKPDQIWSRGWRLHLSDGKYIYAPLGLSAMLEHARGRLIGVYTVLRSQMARLGMTWEEARSQQSVNNKSWGPDGAKEELLLDLGEKIGWTDLVDCAAHGTFMDFLVLSSARLGTDQTRTWLSSFKSLYLGKE